MTSITFTNQPKLSEHEADKAFNERRVALAAQVEGFITSHTRFHDKDALVSFAHKGISSLICSIETTEEKLVLKIPLSTNYAEGEALFLTVWEQAGVKVPRVFDSGSIGGHSYILMECIDAPILMDAYTQEELLQKGIHRELGRILRRMHTPEAVGFGRVVGESAEFTHFDEWLLGADIKKRITYVQEHKLLGDEHGSVESMFEILQDHVRQHPSSSYCHDDFGSANIFATDPLTVFDPNPRFNNGYIDLGRTVFNSIAHGIYPAQLVEGYFEEGDCDEKVLRAAVSLAAYMKFPYSHKVKKIEQMQRVREYLAQI